MKEEKQIEVEVSVKLTMRVNTHPRKWLGNCLSEWMGDILELDEELVNYQIDIEERKEQ